MEWTLENSNNAEEEIQNGDHPNIRHFKVPHSSAVIPEGMLAGGEWQTAAPETAGDFTAVGYFFAKHISQSEAVPIGLLNSSWGGSRIEPWIRGEDLGFGDAQAMADELKSRKEAEKAEFITRLKQKLPHIPEEDLGMKGGQAIWAKPGFDDSKWETMELPILWEQAGWEQTDGVFWFRRTFMLPKGMAIKDATLNLGPIDDSDQTWVNGQLVGSMDQAYNTNRVYPIPSKYLHEGQNTIAVRVDDTGGGGGIYGDPSLLFFEVDGTTIFLDGKWKYKVGMIRLNAQSQSDNQQPTLLYNKMIHPIIKFPIKGVLWYQGESNAGNPEDARAYSDQFKALITSWRKLWKVGDFPFLFVQLANFMAVREEPSASNWALLRESQGKALALKNTGQAVIIDIGEANDIHPRNKQDVGKRLAMAAQKIAYDKEVVSSGPAYRSMKITENKIVLSFDHTGGGLSAKGGESLKGFAIAGEDKNFIWANAKIVGNKVEVSAREIMDPVAVRYAWADNPEGANLYNEEGLPASPFRTDAWKE
jgi:sialate O-acetylesterase